jgi:hypothetical protein
MPHVSAGEEPPKSGIARMRRYAPVAHAPG